MLRRYVTGAGWWAAVLIFSVVLPRESAAAILHVKSGAPTEPAPDGTSWATAFGNPAAALARATAGDEIWIATGTYPGRVEIPSGLALYGGFAGTESLRADRQPDRWPTLIDGLKEAPCVQVLSGPGTTVLDGLVITNGLAGAGVGAGLRAAGATLVLNQVTLTGHVAGEGAAVLATDCDLTVTACRFVVNRTTGLDAPGTHHRGSALFVSGGRLQLENSVFYRQTMSTIFGGLDPLQGGAVYLATAGGVIRGNTWMDTYADGLGGALVCDDASPLIERNRFAGVGANTGGAVACLGSSAPIIRNNLFSDVTAVDYDQPGRPATGGAALFCGTNAAPHFLHNTVQVGYGSAVRLLGSAAVLRNNVFSGVGSRNLTLGIRAPNDFTADHNLFFGFSEGAFSTNLTSLIGQNGNILADPRFLGQPLFGQGRVHPESPAVDSAEVDADAGDLDFEGRPRRVGLLADRGAFESDGTTEQPPYPVVRVRPDGDDSADGTTWATARRTVAGAFAALTYTGGDVWVREGVYEENLVLPYLVNLLGGFAGHETARSQRLPGAHETILDGGRRDRVLKIETGNRAQEVNGFTIRRGFTTQNGGGVYCSVSLQLTGNRFEDNWALVTNRSETFPRQIHGGGALYVYYASPHIAQNVFVGNRVYTTNNIATADPLGGAIAVSVGTPLIEDNYFTGNQAQALALGFSMGQPAGSALAAELGYPGLVIRNNTFLRHRQSQGTTPSTLHFRRSRDYDWVTTPAEVVNNLIAHNEGAVSRQNAAVPLALRGNCFWENGPAEFINIDPALVGQDGNFRADPRLTGNQADPHLLPDSPCRDAGEPGDWPDRRDFDGGARVVGGRIDIGADESDGTAVTVSPRIVRVRVDGDDSQDGSSWAAAKQTLAAALDVVNAEGGEVWVAAGTYAGLVNQSDLTRLLGGFAGTESDAAERDWVAHETIITLPPGPGTEELRNPLKLPLLTLRSPSGRAMVSGFTFRDGLGSQVGGLWGLGSPRVVQNRFVGNRATGSVGAAGPQAGGALFTAPGSPQIFHNLFLSNSLVLVFRSDSVAALACAPNTTAQVVNNTFVAHASSGDLIRLGNTPGEVFANNILVHNDRSLDFGLTNTRFAANCVWDTRRAPAPSPGPQLLLVDPKLVNARAGDVRPRYDSPIRNAADPAWVDLTLEDLNGQPRLQGDQVDLGAVEGGPALATGSVVTLVAPIAGSEFAALANIPFSAAVSPDQPKPVSLRLVANDEEVIAVTNTMAGTWANVMAGSYQVSARAVYADGSVADSARVPVSVQLAPNELPPRFTLVRPANQTTWVVPANLQLFANVSDPSPQGRITELQVLVDGQLLAVRTNQGTSYSIPWLDVRRHTDAVVTFRAKDRVGAVTSTNIILRFVSPNFYGRFLNNALGQPLDVIALADDDAVFGNLEGRPFRLGPDGVLTPLAAEGQNVEVTTASPDGRAAGVLIPVDPPVPIACLFSNEVAIPLPGLENSRPVAFNRSGTLVAVQNFPDFSSRPLLWRDGVVTEMTGFPDGAMVSPRAINDHDVVVGWFYVGVSMRRAFRWEAGVVTEIYGASPDVESGATAINSAGQIVGFGRVVTGGHNQPFLWHEGILTPLEYPEPIGAEASGINDAGVIVGFGDAIHTPLLRRNRVWESLTNQVPDLATVASIPVLAINRAGTLLLFVENRGHLLVRSNTDLPELTTRLESADAAPFRLSLTTPYLLGLDAVLQRSTNLSAWGDVATNRVWELPSRDVDRQFFRTVPRIP